MWKEATPAAVQERLDRGADLRARNQLFDQTPLHEATGSNANPAVVALLLDRGADPRARSTLNHLPVDLADKNEHLQGTDVYWRLNEARF